MAITYKSIQTIESGVNTFTLDATTEYLIFCNSALRLSGTTSFTLDSAYIDDSGGNRLTLTSRIIQKVSNNVNGTVSTVVAMFFGKPTEATPSALIAGTCTLTLGYSTGLNASAPDTFVIECDMGTSASDPYRGAATGIDGAGSDPFTAFGDLALENGGFAVAFAARGSLATMTAAGSATGGTWTQRADDTSFSGARASVQTKDVSADYTETALALNPNTAVGHAGYFVWFKETNNPALTDVDTLPATPGEALTVTGTALDVANTGVRVRMVSTPTAYDTLTFAAGTATSATATMPSMLTEVPFTVGTSQSVEFIATVSGAASGIAFAGSVDVASGYAVVELLTPNTTATESVAANFGVTPAAIDQLYYQTDSGNVVIADSGVPTAGPGYVAGTQLNAYLWDASASSARWLGPIQFQLTDNGTVVTGTARRRLLLGVG
jgi:hypothetical protein